MSVIKKISLKDAVGTATIYDIGSMAENVMYDEDSSVKDKLDNLNIRYLGSQLQVWDSVNEVWVNKIQLDDITYYVDSTNGSDTNAGTQASPFATIGKAIAMIGSDSFRSATAQIIVSDGTYTENVTIVGKNVSITGASGASSNVIIEGTLSASNFAKVYINKIRFNVSNYANVNAIAASNGAYIVAAGGVIVQGDGSNTGFYAFDNGNIKVANSDFVNMDCAFKADGGTIRVNNAPRFTTVVTGALVTNGGVIHLRNDISAIAGVTTPYNKTNAYGGRIFVGSEDTMKGATSTTNGTGGTVPAPQAGDENKALFGDGTYKDITSQLDTKQNVILSSAMTIGGQIITEVEPALRALNEKGGGHTILDEDGITYPQRSKLQFEGCEVTDDAVNGITVVKCEGGGGHTIVDEEGTELTQRSKLQFKGAITSDDETNDATVVETVNPVEYEEDIESLQHQLTDQTNVLGAKNLIPYPYRDTSSVMQGVTFTDNGDGTITANGPITADVNFHLQTNATKAIKLIPGEKYVLSGCPAGGSSKYSIKLFYLLNGAAKYVPTDVGNGATFVMPEYDAGTYQTVFIQVLKGAGTVTNLTFKPMLRLASDPDDTYVPYAMTNRELTEDIVGTYQAVKLSESVSVTADGTTSLGGLLDQLRSVLTTYLSGISSDEVCKITNLNIPNYSGALTCRDSYYNITNNSSGVSLTFYGIAHSSNTIRNFFVLMRSSGSIAIAGNINASGSSYEGGTSTVLASGTVITVYFDKYKKI